MDSTGDGIRLEQISVGEILELAQLSIMKKWRETKLTEMKVQIQLKNMNENQTRVRCFKFTMWMINFPHFFKKKF